MIQEESSNLIGPDPVIKTLFSGGAAKLMDMDGKELFQSFNLDILRKYYVVKKKKNQLS